MKISTLDSLIILIYFIAIISLGLWISRRQAKGGREFFLAGGTMKWPFIGASLFAGVLKTLALLFIAAPGVVASQLFIGQEIVARDILRSKLNHVIKFTAQNQNGSSPKDASVRESGSVLES